MPLRVLHVVTYMGRGGLETMIMNYYRRIDRNRIQFDFLVHRDFEGDYDREILSLGGNIYHVPPLNPLSPGYYAALDRFFKEHPYPIVHSHLDCLSAYPLRSAKKHGAMIRIAHAHSTSQDKNLKYYIKILSKPWMPIFATHLFACGREAGEWMFSGHPFTIMNNAIDVNNYIYSEKKRHAVRAQLSLENRFVIGHVGRFNPPKNHPFLIRVFAEVLKMDANALLLLIGTGDGQQEIREMVENLGISSNVMFLGSRSDVPDLLQAMDVFVFPSLYEGLGIAAVEAQAAGLPCIMSDQVPTECKMTDNVEFLSLGASAETWAERICGHKGDARENMFDRIAAAGYDIQKNAEWLQNFYLSGGAEL